MDKHQCGRRLQAGLRTHQTSSRRGSTFDQRGRNRAQKRQIVMSRPSFVEWATSKGGVYVHDKKKPTLATWQPYQVDILNHIFPGGDNPLPYSRVIWSDVKKAGKSELAYGVQVWFALFVDVPGEQYVLANDFE